MNRPFVLFGIDHWAVMALTLAVPLVLAALVKGRGPRADAAVRIGFAALLIANQLCWYALFYARGWLGLGNVLQMNLCDWAFVATLIALVARNRKAFELSYFWALAGTAQGIVTPDVNYGFPEPQFVVFMLGHADIVAAVLYLIVATGMRPVPASVPRTAGWTLFYLAAAGLTDRLFGVNYAFLREKPNHATLFDLMPGWPWYIGETVVLGLLAILLLYLPWFVADRMRVQALAGAGEGNRTLV